MIFTSHELNRATCVMEFTPIKLGLGLGGSMWSVGLHAPAQALPRALGSPLALATHMHKLSGHFVKAWEQRFCVLLPTTLLLYFETPEDSEPKGIIVLGSDTVCERVGTRDGRDHVCTLTLSATDASSRVLTLAADSEDEARSWCETIYRSRWDVQQHERAALERSLSRASSDLEAALGATRAATLEREAAREACDAVEARRVAACNAIVGATTGLCALTEALEGVRREGGVALAAPVALQGGGPLATPKDSGASDDDVLLSGVATAIQVAAAKAVEVGAVLRAVATQCRAVAAERDALKHALAQAHTSLAVEVAAHGSVRETSEKFKSDAAAAEASWTSALNASHAKLAEEKSRVRVLANEIASLREQLASAREQAAASAAATAAAQAAAASASAAARVAHSALTEMHTRMVEMQAAAATGVAPSVAEAGPDVSDAAAAPVAGMTPPAMGGDGDDAHVGEAVGGGGGGTRGRSVSTILADVSHAIAGVDALAAGATTTTLASGAAAPAVTSTAVTPTAASAAAMTAAGDVKRGSSSSSWGFKSLFRRNAAPGAIPASMPPSAGAAAASDDVYADPFPGRFHIMCMGARNLTSSLTGTRVYVCVHAFGHSAMGAKVEVVLRDSGRGACATFHQVFTFRVNTPMDDATVRVDVCAHRALRGDVRVGGGTVGVQALDAWPGQAHAVWLYLHADATRAAACDPADVLMPVEATQVPGAAAVEVDNTRFANRELPPPPVDTHTPSILVQCVYTRRADDPPQWHIPVAAPGEASAAVASARAPPAALVAHAHAHTDTVTTARVATPTAAAVDAGSTLQTSADISRRSSAATQSMLEDDAQDHLTHASAMAVAAPVTAAAPVRSTDADGAAAEVAALTRKVDVLRNAYTAMSASKAEVETRLQASLAEAAKLRVMVSRLAEQIKKLRAAAPLGDAGLPSEDVAHATGSLQASVADPAPP